MGMLKLGQKVIIVGDAFEQNLPIGDYAYIIAYDRNADNAFDYVIRSPKSNRNFFVPASDVELEEVLLSEAAERIEREVLIDFALATRNEQLFRQLTRPNGEEAEEKQKSQTTEEFIRQINVKAWI